MKRFQSFVEILVSCLVLIGLAVVTFPIRLIDRYVYR